MHFIFNFAKLYNLYCDFLLGDVVETLIDVGGVSLTDLVLLVEDEVLDLFG